MLKRLAIVGLVVMIALSVWAAVAQEEETSVPIVVALDVLTRADAAFNAADYERAVLDYSLFLLLNPTFSVAYYNRALAYIGLNDYDAAFADLSEALALNPPAPDYVAALYLLRAQLSLEKNDVEAALTDLDSSIERAPQAVENLLTRARVYSTQERYTDAIADFDRVLTINPENVEGLIARAFAHQELLDFESALEDMDTAIRLNPQESQFYLFRASIKDNADDVEAAASDYLQWLQRIQTRQNNAADTLLTSQQFVLEMAEGLIYTIPFAAQAGQTISVSADGASASAVDPLLLILGQNGQPLVGNDDGGGNMNAAIQNYVIPQAGQYTLVVGHALGGTDGDILVSLDLGD